MKWRPDVKGDGRAEIPDVGVGNFTLPGVNSPHFKLCFGIEAKRSIKVMEFLPPAALLITSDPVVIAFHRLSFQARNQAKAAIKNGYPIAQNGGTVEWILLIGP